MPDMAQLETALRSADAAGDAEAARTIAQAIQSQRAAPKGPSPSGFAMGLGDIVHGGAQLLTNVLPKGVVDSGNRLNNWLAEKTGLVAKLPDGGVDQQVREREATYQQARADSGQTGIDWARVGGNVANPLTLAMGAVAAPARGASLMARMGTGGATGAATSALSPVGEGDFAAEKQKQVALGGLFGAALPAVAAGVGRIISPSASVNPQLQLLKDEGVRPTVGQSLGGWVNKVEEKATSLPVVGDAIAAARGSAREDFNLAALNRAGAPVGFKATQTGQDGVREVGDAISAAYKAAESKLGHFQIDRQGAAELANLQQMAQGLQPAERKVFDRIWQTLNSEVSPNASLTAEAFKRLDAKVGMEARRFGGSQDGYQQQLGDALKELQRVITENAKRANPEAAALYSAADKAWAQLVRVEGAAKSAQNSGGVFTPAQLQSAVRQADSSVRDRATARGTALMQDLSNAGQSVLGNKVPDSGTAGRMFMGGGALGAGFMTNPAIPAALIGGAGLYSQPAQSFLRGLVSARPALAEPVAGLLNQAAPMFGPAGGLLGLQMANQ